MPLFRKFSVFFVCTGCSSLHGWEEIEDVARLLFGRWGWLLFLSRANDPAQSSGDRRGAHWVQRGHSGLRRRFYSWYLASKKRDPENAGSLVEHARGSWCRDLMRDCASVGHLPPSSPRPCLCHRSLASPTQPSHLQDREGLGVFAY